ncbi:MAG: beta-eliminating lyase-related protein [Pseudomonadota bacterium]
MNFASDNVTGAHPAILAALTAANDGPAMPYGNDPLTASVEVRIREVFEAPRARVLLVGTGTAANALALAALCPPWGAVYCHRIAHIEEDECNAPEFFTGGAKLVHIDGDHAMMDAEALEARLAGAGAGVVHNVQPAALSLTQATERGGVYTPEAVARLASIARARGLGVHLDGTRLANALAATGASPADMTHRAGVDILCLGATKCGAMAAEAIVLFEPDAHAGRAWELELRRKRAGHLFSKMRFVAAQMEGWLADGLWLDLAGHANAMATRLRQGLAAAGADILTPEGANLFFARLTAAQDRALRAAGAHYYAGTADADGRVEARFVCSFVTTPGEVDAAIAALATQAA